MEDLQDTETYVRGDPKVIEQCKILGITDMTKVYCDRACAHTLLPRHT